MKSDNNRIVRLALRNGIQLLATVTALTVLVGRVNAFELTSPDVKPGEPLADKFAFSGLGCQGQNISPALNWTNPPEGTKSFALMAHDPDAVTGGAGIWHWFVINIPATANSIAQNAGTGDGAKLPEGSRQITNDYMGFLRSPGRGGPRPPKGRPAHNYKFSLYALKTEKLNLPPDATSSQAGFVVNINAIDKTKMTISFGR